MTTYVAKQVIGSNSAQNPAGALLQSGANRANDSTTGDTWIFLDSRGGTTSPWGIKHSQSDDKVIVLGSGTIGAWTRMNTGDTYLLGKLGLGYNPETSGNTYKLYVNGTSFFGNGITVRTGGIWVQANSEAGSNNTRMGLTSGMPDKMPYNSSKRGVFIYSNAIAFADPYNGNSNTDAGWIRHQETGANAGELEIGVGDDGNETVVVRQYNTSSSIVRTLTLLNSSGYTLFPSYINIGGHEKNASSPPYVWGSNSSDNYLRSYQTSHLSVASATYASSYLASRGSVSGSNHAEALKAYFNSYKSSEPRNCLVAHYSSAYGNGSLCMGYFLSGYDSNPYGGFFVCHYNNPRYVGIQNGGYTEHLLLSNQNYASYVSKIGTADKGANNNPIYLAAGVPTACLAPASGAWFRGVPQVGSNGVLEIGRYIDFHTTNASTADYDFRFNCDANGQLKCSGKLYGAVWNDYAEFRISNCNEPGRVIIPSLNGIAIISNTRLQPGGRIISDTFGHAIGESDAAKTPIALSGRVLAYPYQNLDNYKIGDCVCSAPNGTVDIMTREEIKEYPDRIIGIVNEIPTYNIWTATFTGEDGHCHTQSVPVLGRIWIDVK